MAGSRHYKRLYLPLDNGDAIVVAEDIGREAVVLSITPSGSDRSTGVILSLEEWKALSGLYYEMGLYPPCKATQEK